MNEERTTIKSLDGLRGLAVMLVLLSHLSLHGMNVIPSLDFSGIGKAGVYLFFVLSAFLLTYQPLSSGWPHISSIRYWKGYFIRRVCRIFPLYIVVLLVAFTLTTQTQGYGPKIPDTQAFISHLFLQSGTSIYWAIPVEFSYYIVLPAVCIALYFSSQFNPWSSALLLLVALFVVHILWPSSETQANSIVLGPYLQMFFLGSFAGLIMANHEIVAALKKRDRVVGWTGWILLGMLCLTIPAFWRSLVDPSADNKIFHAEYLGYGIAWTLSVVAVLYGGVGFTRFFERAIWRFLGRISFSIYLWHLPIVQWIDRETSFASPLQFFVAILASLGVGFVSYRLIERPFITWGHRLT